MKDRKKRRLTGIERIARHEAGHAVVALACGVLVAGIAINDENGQVDSAYPLGKRDPLIEGMIAWGGSVAEGVDYINEVDAYPFDRYGFTGRSVLTMRQHAMAILRQYGDAVEALTRALAERRAIFGPDAKRIAVKACPALRKDAPTYPREAIASLKARFDRTRKRYGA